MTKSLALAFAALALSAGAALASPVAAPVARGVILQNGIQAARVIDTPLTRSSGHSAATPIFDYGTSIPVTASIPASSATGGAAPQDSGLFLVNRTGGGR